MMRPRPSDRARAVSSAERPGLAPARQPGAATSIGCRGLYAQCVSHLVLIAPSDGTKIFTDDPANAGYDGERVRALLELADVNGDSYEVVDSDGLSEDDRENRYLAVGVRAAALRIRLSSHFGSRNDSGASGFGREVPALVVYDKIGGTVIDVYPHSRKAGPLETIADFLAAEAS